MGDWRREKEQRKKKGPGEMGQHSKSGVAGLGKLEDQGEEAKLRELEGDRRDGKDEDP